MAKDKSLSKEERKAAKKATKEVKIEANGVSKVKSDKKEKKEKKAKKEALAGKMLDEIESTDKKNDDVKMNGVGKDGEVVSENEDEGTGKTDRPIGALVPFANPLADEKVGKKVFKSVKKGVLHDSVYSRNY
jgi:H/ACA ribonucleoprotein complex subunit 2